MKLNWHFKAKCSLCKVPVKTQKDLTFHCTPVISIQKLLALLLRIEFHFL